MDYERKRRNITYHSDSCKMYLRHDFAHKCAYCGVIEEVISPIPEVADKFFEKDHFTPQKNNPPGLHTYPNLYYSCTSCNNKKDSDLLPLDPCSQNIFCGEHPHIDGGVPETNYLLTSTTTEGDTYITALELNSRYHIAIREKQYAWMHAKAESERIFRDLKEQQALEASDLQKIATAIGLSSDPDPYKCICGGSKHAAAFVEACYYLESKGYQLEVVLDENEMDIKVIMEDATYWGTIYISDSITTRKIKTDILQKRRQKSEAYGLFVYLPKTTTMCFYKIDFEIVDWSKKEFHTSTYIYI